MINANKGGTILEVTLLMMDNLLSSAFFSVLTSFFEAFGGK